MSDKPNLVGVDNEESGEASDNCETPEPRGQATDNDSTKVASTENALSLEHALRDFIKKEIQAHIDSARLPPKKTTPKLTRGEMFCEIFVFALILANLILLFLVIPEELLKDERVRHFSNAFMWLGTTAFTVAYAWFRTRMLALLNNRIFVVVQLLLFFFLLSQQVPWIPTQHEVKPANAQLFIDGNREFKSDVLLSFGPHNIVVRPAPNSCTDKARSFDLRWFDLRPWKKYAWTVLCEGNVFFKTDDAGATIEIKPTDTTFDATFMARDVGDPSRINGLVEQSTPDSLVIRAVTVDQNQNRKRVNSPSVGLCLPVGEFNVTLRRPQCKPRTLALSVKGDEGFGLIFTEKLQCDAH